MGMIKKGLKTRRQFLAVVFFLGVSTTAAQISAASESNTSIDTAQVSDTATEFDEGIVISDSDGQNLNVTKNISSVTVAP